MTNMIRTPLGQYINKDKIEYFEVISSGVLKENSNPLVTGSYEDKYFVIANFTNKDAYLTVSDYYETKEEAQKELDNMMGPTPNYSGINKDLIKDKHLLIQSGSRMFDYALITYSVGNTWFVSSNKAKGQSFETFEQAYNYFITLI